MSTPVDLNIVMPYGATMVGDGTQYAKLAKPHPKQNGGSSLNLPDGPCRVAASWAGNPDTVSVNMYEGRNFVRTLGKIQAGGGSFMANVGAKAGFFVQCVSSSPIPASTTGTLEVFPTNVEL